MKRDARSDDFLSPPAEQVALALARIEHSASFRQATRHRALLRHLVEHMQAGELASLKETVIAVEVFARPPGQFDPQQDSIVRVETRRLRARLAAYYRGEGREVPIRIELPVGSYVPVVVSHEPALHDADATRRARDLVERGEHFLRQALSAATLEQALIRFEAAQAESPRYAPAYVGAGRAWLNLATGWYREPSPAAAQAAQALRHALEIDARQPVAHALLGAVQHQFEYDWPAAQRSFQHAVALAPREAFVHSAYGRHLLFHGALDQADGELALARELDPQYINTRMHMVNLRIAQGRLDDAEAEIEAMCDIAPATVATTTLRAVIAMFRGDAETAVRLFEHACEAAPEHPGCFVSLASAHAMAGRHDVADALHDETLERFAGQPISAYVRAIFSTRRGRHDEAFALLQQAVTEHDPNAIQIPLEPSFADLRTDPRWAALIGRLRPAKTKASGAG